MKAEYFPPKVEIILQNEIPTDFYIIVSGEVVIFMQFITVHVSMSVAIIIIIIFSGRM